MTDCAHRSRLRLSRLLAAWLPEARARRVVALNLALATLMSLLGVAALAPQSEAASSGLSRAPVPLAHPAAALPAVATPAAVRPALPSGKGMWIWQPSMTEGGRVEAILARARAVGLSHIYVRTGSSWDGFHGGPFMDRILPAAHKAGLRVYGWDFPKLSDWQADVRRGATAIRHRTPSGHRLDGFVADIETHAEGTHLTSAAAGAYGAGLRRAAGQGYPLVVAVPRPSAAKAWYPYDVVSESFDAIAPMVYWLNREPGSDVAGALRDLARFGKPVIPVGQAYDGAPEGGRPGVPPRAELMRFLRVAEEKGAAGASFWSWQAANQQAWDAIRDSPHFRHR